jgi:hypothetical protein
MYLALLETSANQQFIFSTNKLRENIGASELTYIAGSKWVVEAIANINNAITDQQIFESSSSFRDWLLDNTKNRPIEDSAVKIEIILATSGKALFLAKEREDARSVIRQVTQKALREAPGLDICGVISEEFDINVTPLSTINKQIHNKFESIRAQRPGPDSRFLRLPIVTECATSGMPATIVIRDNEDKITVASAVSDAKRQARNQGFNRIERILKQRNINWAFVVEDSEFEQRNSWKAIVHADGNGLGQIFLDFGKNLGVGEYRKYIEQYRQFSCAIDICTEESFLDAIHAVFADRLKRIPMRPLILGGDDLTVICAGEYALQFTAEFLTSFENRTSRAIENFVAPEIILDQARQHLPVARLSACAGVAIVKQHFPFSVAYHLAEDLIKSAKTVKEIVKNEEGQTIPCSAIDYHMLYDSSGVELEFIRNKLHINHPPTRLYSRPYVVSHLEWYVDSPGYQWVDRHHWRNLAAKVAVLIKKDNDDRYVLPNSQIHDLREGLFLGHKGADSRYQRIRHRYKDNIEILDGDEGSLFWPEAMNPNDGQSPTIQTTALLDAMDAANFWEKAQ